MLLRLFLKVNPDFSLEEKESTIENKMISNALFLLIPNKLEYSILKLFDSYVPIW